jgi:anti-sigma regulatory factor (Ser/Thr protein kinase)
VSAGSGSSGREACAPPSPQPLRSVTVEARSRNLRSLRQVIRDTAEEAGCGEACVRDIVIAIDEACQNVIRHGYGGDGPGEIIVEVGREGDRLVFNVIDFADPVDPETVQPRDLTDLRPGGLGTHFINECMDHWSFTSPPAGAGNCLTMSKRIA